MIGAPSAPSCGDSATGNGTSVYAAAPGLAALSPVPDWAFESLVAALADEEAAVRAMVAKAVGMSKNVDAIDPLVTALEDPSRTVQLEAALGLDELGQRTRPSVR